MQRLSGVDALFVEMETRRMPQAVMAVLVLDPAGIPGGYSFKAIKDHFASRLNEIPQLPPPARAHPFRLGHPMWVDDPDFDVDAHIHRAGLPAPGGPAELAEFVADVAGRSLDRDRPLWETWVVEGLAGGNVALVAKSHHSLMDGVTGADFISRLFDAVPEIPPRVPPEIWAPPTLPSQARLLVEALPGALMRPASLVTTGISATKGAVGFLRVRCFVPKAARRRRCPSRPPIPRSRFHLQPAHHWLRTHPARGFENDQECLRLHRQRCRPDGLRPCPA